MENSGRDLKDTHNPEGLALRERVRNNYNYMGFRDVAKWYKAWLVGGPRFDPQHYKKEKPLSSNMDSHSWAD